MTFLVLSIVPTFDKMELELYSILMKINCKTYKSRNILISSEGSETEMILRTEQKIERKEKFYFPSLKSILLLRNFFLSPKYIVVCPPWAVGVLFAGISNWTSGWGSWGNFLHRKTGSCWGRSSGQGRSLGYPLHSLVAATRTGLQRPFFHLKIEI